MGFAAGVLNVSRAFKELGKAAQVDADAGGRKPSGQG
jgi:hypothetical protein